MKEIRFKVVEQDPQSPCLQAIRGPVEATSRTVHVPDDEILQLWTVTGPRARLDRLERHLDSTPHPPLVGTDVPERAARNMRVAATWRPPREEDPATVEKLLGTLAWARMPVTTRIHGGEIRARALDPDCDALEALFDRVETGFSGTFDVTLLRAGELDRSRPARCAPIHEDQAALLQQALELGYYEEPRECSIRDLGERLGMSKSCVARRLRRIERAAVLRLHRDASPDVPRDDGGEGG